MTETTHLRWQQWLDGIAQTMAARRAHPARTIVLLPYAQLMAEAARRWAARFPDGFVPRFETTQNWCQSLGTVPADGADFTGDAGWDLLTARALLEQAGLRDQAQAATAMLVESVPALAQQAAAVPPARRAAWAQQLQAAAAAGLDDGALRLESVVAQVAVIWAGQSSYRSDRLFTQDAMAGVDCLVLVPGYQHDPLHHGLIAQWGEKVTLLGAPALSQPQESAIFQSVADAGGEARMAAAAVMRHLAAGRSPVALPVIDRALTRQIRALLGRRDVQIRDETGWKLSTTRSAAQIMLTLRASAIQASGDVVLDWIKHTRGLAPDFLSLLESSMRRAGKRLWRQYAGVALTRDMADWGEDLARIEAWRARLVGRHALREWLDLLGCVLQECGLLDGLRADPAGVDVLAALRLDSAQAATWPTGALWERRRLSLTEFTAWVDGVLESASFKPAYPRHEQVVVLPMAQMLGRDFGAVVICGCDEQRLPSSSEPAGLWNRAQRLALGLPDREALAASQRAAWCDALDRPHVQVFWRSSDASGEPLLASPLVLWAQWTLQRRTRQPLPVGQDPRVERMVAPLATTQPAPGAGALCPTRISASAYHDLRQCPYRFFALRMLGLREIEELESELDKRDFGLWLHEVLERFHAGESGGSIVERRDRLDAAARAVAQAQELDDDEFLPFWAAWPGLRDGYLDWLARHEAEGWVIDGSELRAERELGGVVLHGRLDRIDRRTGTDDAPAAGDGPPEARRLVIDYKTESPQKTRDRIKAALEDTQLPFYAALFPDEDIRAAYLNLGEREGVVAYEPTDLHALRDALCAGLRLDIGRAAANHPLAALGAGAICDACAARGLCRKDFWGDL